MRWARVGRDNAVRLRWSKYYKYTLEGKEFYIKEKAYTSRDDGWIKIEEIKKQTYRNAIKRKDECIEIQVEENILGIPITCLKIILGHIYKLDNLTTGRLIIKTQEKLKKIKEESETSAIVDYKIFKSIFEKEVELVEME